MRYHQYFEYILLIVKTWAQAISNPKQFIFPYPPAEAVVTAMEFYAVLVLLSILLGAPVVVAQKGDLADKTRLAANGVFSVISMSAIALTWHISFWAFGGKSSFSGTFLAYVYAGSPYVPLTALATWIVASAYPKRLLVYWVVPGMAHQAMKEAKDDPNLSRGMVALGCFSTSGILIWSLIVMLRCMSYVHALTGWRRVGAVLSSVLIAIPVAAVLRRMGTLLQAEEEGAKKLTRRIIDELWNKGNLDVASELFAEEARIHDPAIPSTEMGPEGIKQFVRSYRTAFPDLYMDVDDQMGEDNLVVTRWTLTGTHAGTFGDIPASGRHVSVKGITIYRFYKGEVAEGWMNWDALGLLRQLGLHGEANEQKAAPLLEEDGRMLPVPTSG